MNMHILGGPGSGKTTLARRLARQHQLRYVDWDHLGRRFGPRPDPYLTATQALVQQGQWVTEGIYLIFVDLLLLHANHIVLLEVSWPTAARRIVQRHVVNTVRGTNHYPGIKNFMALLRGARAYYLNQRPDTVAAVQAYQRELAEWTPPTPDSIRRRLEQYPTLIIPPTAAFVRAYLAPYRDKLTIVTTPTDQQQFVQRLASRRVADRTERS